MNVWELYKGTEKLADIKKLEFDQPWFFGELSIYPAFEKYKPLFEKTRYFIEREDFDSQESEHAFLAIEALQLSLKDLGKQELYTDVIVNIEGSEVWWRI